MLFIRRMKKEDYPRVIELLRQIGDANFTPMSEDELVVMLARWSFYPLVVVEKDGLIVATATLTICPTLKGWRGYVDYVVTDEPHRHRGHTHCLMSAIDVLAERFGIRRIHLTTSNEVARGIYKSLGYETKPRSMVMVKKFFSQ